MALVRWLLPRHRFCCDALNDAHVTIGVLQRRTFALEREKAQLERALAVAQDRLELAEGFLAVVDPPT